ncbi:MAG: 16S rRNA (adenine(1518)-N(6)/adenine(1519)-N(6))-dimethyltransferase RsmA [Chromatiaceae bacterium]
MSHRPRKRFGQNFLHDQAVIERILGHVNPKPGDHLVEIGPGRGALTLGLLQRTGALDAVELDRDLLEPLRRRCASLGALRLHNADALTFDFRALRDNGRRLRLVGNLPYNISTPLLFHLIEQADAIEDMHFMLQKEVVDRMAAGPGSKTYGRLSVMLQVSCEVTPLFDIGPEAFDPPPKVASSMVRLYPLPAPLVAAEQMAGFARLIKAAFAHRRKTLRNNLKGVLDADRISALGIDPNTRTETLSPADLIRLHDALA